MAFDSNNQRKPLLFSDLFKRHRNMAPEKEQQDIVVSSCSSSSTMFSSSCGDSSSSGFSTPLCCDLGTSESEDSDFFAELTRQMAECMLREVEGEENTVENYMASRPAKITADESYPHSGDVNCLNNGFDDQMSPKVQVYEVKNQPPVSKEGRFCLGKRVKGIESAHQKQSQKTEQKHTKRRLQEERRNGYSGSAMQVVLLGGPGSRSGSSGTGVFLPRAWTELKNKSGCSTVLIPTRVLQVLELHFSRYQDSTAPPPLRRTASTQDESMISNGPSDGRPEPETRPVYGDEMQLPQEWTY